MQLQTQGAWLSQPGTGTSIAEDSHLSCRAGLSLLLPHTALVPPTGLASPLLSHALQGMQSSTSNEQWFLSVL